MVPFNLVRAGSYMPETGGFITPEGDTHQHDNELAAPSHEAASSRCSTLASGRG